MKNWIKLNSITLASIALVFMFLILISSVASASQVAAQVTRIGNGSDPAIYGSKVVWTDSGVIHVYDLTSKTDTTVSSSAASHPAIYGNKLVWHDESSGVPRLTVYDIPSGARSYITKDVDNYSIPAIYGNRIVWSANYNESSYNYNVYMRDISTSTQTKITEGNSPDIYDTKITYGYEGEDGRIIAVYDINTKETIDIHSSSQVFSPYIYGNKVIWSDFYSRDGYIQMYDLVTKKTIDVTSDNTGNTLSIVNEYGYDVVDAGDDTGTHININGDKIVYSKSGDDQFGYAGVYVYDIPSVKSTPVYIYPRGTYTTPDIYNDTIVWGIGSSYGGVNDTGIYICDLSVTNTLPPVAAFTANTTYGTVPLVVRFTDLSTGGVPNSWYWDFGDDTNSKHATNATHTFTNPGVYNVTLIVANEAGNSTVRKPNYITVTPPQPPVADFSTNVTSGTAPLTVLFAATSKGGATSKVEEPTSWYWDFGDGTNSKDSATIHTFTKPGNYTISLTVGNIIGNNTTTKPDYIVVTDPNAPVANFSSNVTQGYSPLSIQFTDLSQNAESRSWDFGDANTSTEQNPMHIYSSAGNYSVNLTVSNENGTTSKTTMIYVLEKSRSSDERNGNKGGSSSGRSSGGGGAGGSPEPARNVEVKELSQAQVSNGKPVKFDFTKNATCVVYVSFDSKRTAGKTTAIAEQLKGKSTLVSELDSGEVYKYFNLWVGNSGFATPSNIENPLVCFKVEKAWIQDKKIDKSSITLSRFSDKKWNQLSTNQSGENDKYLYFTTNTPGFSPFVITGKTKANVNKAQPLTENKTHLDVDNTQNKTTAGSKITTIEQTPEQKQSSSTSGIENTKTSGFEITSCIFCLLSLFLYKRR
jgi:PGF-pre-PGF domain-containing protein